MNNDFEVCDGKTFRGLCHDIIMRSEIKDNQLDTLFSDVRGHIKNINDAQIFLPRIKELFDVGIKNDEQLVKLASVVQRLQSSQVESSGGDMGVITDEEKEQLLQNIAASKLGEIKLQVDAEVSSSVV